jgi:hypothetical protein
MKRLTSVSLALVLSATAWALSMPPGWDFGTAGDGKPIAATFSVTNDESGAVELTLVSPCDCLTLSPSRVSLEPGQSAIVAVSFDPAGYSGSVSKPVLVRVNGTANRLYTVTGTVVRGKASLPAYSGECEWCRKQSEQVRRQAYEAWRTQPSVVHYYFSPECSSCARFIDREVPRVEKLLGKKIDLDLRDIRLPGVMEELDALLEGRDMPLTALPVLVAGETVLMGAAQIDEGFQEEMARRLGK